MSKLTTALEGEREKVSQEVSTYMSEIWKNPNRYPIAIEKSKEAITASHTRILAVVKSWAEENEKDTSQATKGSPHKMSLLGYNLALSDLSTFLDLTNNK